MYSDQSLSIFNLSYTFIFYPRLGKTSNHIIIYYGFGCNVKQATRNRLENNRCNCTYCLVTMANCTYIKPVYYDLPILYL